MTPEGRLWKGAQRAIYGPARVRSLRRPRPPACIYRLRTEELQKILWTIAVILLILWALGMVTAYTASGFIHVLVVLAIVFFLIRLVQGRRPISLSFWQDFSNERSRKQPP